MRLDTEIQESVTMAIQAVVTHKLRSVLATLGIVIGVVTVSLMSMTIDGINKSFMGCMSELNTGAVFVERDNWMERGNWRKARVRREITLDQAKQMIKLVRDRYVVAPYVSEQVCTISYNAESVSGVRMKGTTEEYILISSREMADGCFFDNKEVDGARPFLTSAHVHISPPLLGEMHLASAALFDVGVYITVVGATMLMISVLGDSRHSSMAGPVPKE